MSSATFDADLIVNGRGCILGRVASHIAERALDGDRIALVNAESLIITGSRDDVVGRFERRLAVGSDRGPYYPKRPDRIAKRSIRGMLPYKRPRGRDALERVRVFLGNPYDEAGDVIDGTSLDRLSNIRFVELGDVSADLGANVTW